MGRGVRDAEDYCAVLLLGNELSLAVVNQESRAMFSSATRKQIELSDQISEQIAGDGIQEIRRTLGIFLSRDPDWIAISKRFQAGIEYDSDGKINQLSRARREVFNKAVSNDFSATSKVLQEAINSLEDSTQGWYLEELASYEHFASPANAQKILNRAKQLNASTLKPAAPSAPKPLKGTSAQAAKAADYLSNNHKDSIQLRLKIKALLDDLVWDNNQTNRAEQAMRDIGKYLGFVSSRPEQETGDGPDNLWALDESTHAVIELKTGVSRSNPKISKDEAGQLSVSINWHEEINPHVVNRIPILVHPSNQLHHDAHLPKNTRLITPDKLRKLKENIAGYSERISEDEGWKDRRVIFQALVDHRLTTASIIETYTERNKQ